MPQPFINPNYFNQYPQYQQMYQPVSPMPQPYMDRLSQLQAQQMQNAPMTNGNQFAPIGKMVESIDIVKATDIPMDGNAYYFPKADGSEIFSKQWMPNGTTQILSYKPVLDAQTNISTPATQTAQIGLSNEVTEAFMKRFDELADRLDRMEKSIKPSRSKKEVIDDE